MRSYPTESLALTVALCLLAAPTVVAAPILLGTSGAGGDISDLVEVDQSTGAIIRTIGSVGYPVNGLAMDPTTGILYGSTASQEQTYNGLITIDLLTGAGTPVAAASGWGLGTREAITNLAINSSGELYGWWEPGQDALVSIDPATGVATRVGDSGVSTYAHGLAFDAADTLFLVNGDGLTYSVDSGTGAATYLFDLGAQGHHGAFHPTSGLYYGVHGHGNRFFIIADLSTRDVSGTRLDYELHTLAFVESVPEPSVLSLFGLGVAALGLRRRSR